MSSQMCLPRPCLPRPKSGPIAATKRWRWRRMPGCGPISACSGAFSAIPCATRRAPTCSTWSSASGRPRSGSIATRTSWRGGNSKPSSTACRPADTVRIVRAFSYFSHLANIAEDQNNIRQMRGRGPGGPRPSALTQTLSHAKTAGFSAAELRAFFQGCPGQPGADRAPDRSPPQEHDGPRDGDRGAARPARTHAAYAGGGRSQRRAIAPRRADAVADQSAAPDQAHRARRSRQRPFVLRLHVPARGAAAALHARRPAEPGGGRRARRTGVLPDHGKLDRRRPRRQPVRHRRRHARHAAAAVEPGAELLSGGIARARRRTVAGGASRRRFRGIARARRALARHVAASQRRAVSPRGVGNLCPVDRDCGKAGGRDDTAAGRRGRAL